MSAIFRYMALAAFAAFACSASLAQQAPPKKSPAAAQAAPTAVTASDDDERALEIAIKPWKGDFQQMLERKLIRVLVPDSRTL